MAGIDLAYLPASFTADYGATWVTGTSAIGHNYDNYSYYMLADKLVLVDFTLIYSTVHVNDGPGPQNLFVALPPGMLAKRRISFVPHCANTSCEVSGLGYVSAGTGVIGLQRSADPVTGVQPRWSESTNTCVGGQVLVELL